MPKDTLYTKAFSRAHASLGRSLQIAIDRTGGVPIGHQIIDPRTKMKRMGALDDEEMQAVVAHDVNNLRTKSPIQNPKTAAAGKVVDPTAIESAQAADSVSIDTAGGIGGSNIPYSEGS